MGISKGRKKFKANFWGVDGKRKLPNAEAVKEITSRIDGKDYDVTKVEKKNGNVILHYLYNQ